MKTIVVTTLVVATVAAWIGLSRSSDEALAASAGSVLVSVGDRVNVDAAPLGCRVTRLSRYGNRVFVDCRRGGHLAGTYGVYFGAKDVLVVRFVDSRKAKVVLHARQEGEAARCS
jgi:hypothetical protein